MAAISRVYTVARVAEFLGVDEELLWDLANGMDEYDGCLWIYDVGDNQTMAFSDYGIENLQQLIADFPLVSKPESQ
jgi:hypothetical protein